MTRYILLTVLMGGVALLCSCNQADEHTEDSPADEGRMELSQQALINLGVTIEEVDSSDFTIYETVPAVVAETAGNERPLAAPFSGRVQSVNVELGQYIKSGQAVCAIIRDPIERPTLGLVEDLLKPTSEELHEAVADLRKERRELTIVEKEIKRLSAFNDADGEAIIPRQTLIDLEYEREKLLQGLENLKNKLTLHGYDDKEIAEIEKGMSIVRSKNLWMSALKQNGLWSEQSAELFELLPEAVRRNRWCVATIGELVAEGLIDQALIDWFIEAPGAAAYFLEIGSLLQQGNSLADIQDLYSMDAFNPVISLTAPEKTGGWDVEAINVNVGERVESGTNLVTLSNHSLMYLVANPVGSEIALLNQAVASRLPLKAIPLAPQAGPTFDNLFVAKILGNNEAGDNVLIPVNNAVLNETVLHEIPYRNWSLRNGLKYFVQIPAKVFADVIVLPSGAVVDSGADKIIFVQGESGGFDKRKVVVLFQNNAVAVIQTGTDVDEVLPLDPMVVSGSFALNLALAAGDKKAEGKPGEGHVHGSGCDH